MDSGGSGLVLMAGSCKHDNETSCTIKGEFLGQKRDYLLKLNSALLYRILVWKPLGKATTWKSDEEMGSET
jgi:hypothetical protein